MFISFGVNQTFFFFFFLIGPQTFSLYLPIIRSQSLFKGVSGYNDLKDRL